MTYPNQPPRPGPPPGGFRPGPAPGGFRPGPPPAQPAPPATAGVAGSPEYRLDATGGTGHPAVDAVLQSLANAATLAPSDQIAEYEAAHQVLQETLASIDR
ncbi:hypothetical protein GCM10020358_11880 [Amorphoplanes nipponensis]|uniref:Uncharacterized protein n=1 Tax=Actinoplanes nipponensis TaxID=135950 RepID=A0A919JPR6_9ACTN|nr:hypothetical protein [Actinoplanes nipponensis]GIE53071.1 hypothetical protein Ani05nite_66050 [Actinoplanes nipponensis]